jgi:antitoxin component of MazEF toxin-antitoxin module
MIETEVKLKKWGSSVGAIFPKEELKKEGLREGQTVRVRLMTTKNPLKKMFGTFKSKKTTARLMREIDRELYND